MSDERGLVWPENIAPFRVHLIDLDQAAESQKIYDTLQAKGVDVLWDDRDPKKVRPGEKFADSDLIGIPWRIVVSSKSIEAGGIEVKKRREDDASIMSSEDFFALL
jgi:prolyl-tRNA synthetase